MTGRLEYEAERIQTGLRLPVDLHARVRQRLNTSSLNRLVETLLEEWLARPQRADQPFDWSSDVTPPDDSG